MAIATGDEYDCAIQAGTGRVVCWGASYYGETSPPASVNGTAGTATAVAAAGGYFTLAIVNVDADRDGVNDTVDNCPLLANADQSDADHDGIGDVCDASTIFACANGADDDGDGLADAADPGCDGADDNSEQTTRFACDNGIDDDGDGFVDMADRGCPTSYASPENPSCDDGIDNDGNGLVDFADPNCSSGWPFWERTPACGLGFEIAPALCILMAAKRRLRARSR